ncbi:MAG: 3-deoxy-7-phosphoheptulonate synthase [Gammaproteobacteria bacterium]|nr:3-deoxy-7-phosphoheptulonate synthase [Gammaproteobacteria bacterium]
MSTNNRRIKAIDPILPPSKLLAKHTITPEIDQLVTDTRNSISGILHRRDGRLLVVVGPCSIHDPVAAMDYARQLTKLRVQHQRQLEVIMRVYFEKPRTTIGWKGLINDPHLNGSFDVDTGLDIARKLLLDINALGLPAGSEFLDAVTGQYYADLISWGAIGARTTESQVHRELASGLSCPIGFKNGTNGNIDIAADAVIAAQTEHVFLSPTEQGTTALFTTAGNADAHVILRGGRQPNYDRESVASASEALTKRGIDTGLMIDFSHANSSKQYQRQLAVGKDVAGQVAAGTDAIVGCMIESHLREGNQAVKSAAELVYGQSITDACINIDQTAELLAELATSVDLRRSGVKI